MSLVRRFILPGAVAARDDVFVAGAGLFAKGVLDVPSGDNLAIATVRAVVPEATDLGLVDPAVIPPPVLGTNDPYPQYMTLADATTSVTAGTDAFAAALRATFVPFWKPGEAVTLGTVRTDPTGHSIVSNSARTTRPTFDTTEQAAWTFVTAGAGGLVSSVVGQTGAITADQITDAINVPGNRLSDAALKTAYVASLPAPSGDATGATDVAVINAALIAASTAGGGKVFARPSVVYQIGIAGTSTVLNPSGSTASAAYCVQIPSNVTLDMNGSTLQLRGSTEATLVCNANLTGSGTRDHDYQLLNAVLDARNVTFTARSMLQLAYSDRVTLRNVKVINGVNQGGWIYDVTNSRFDLLDCDGFQGQPWTLGNPQATGTGHNMIYDSWFGALRGRNVTLLNTGSQPGNPYNLVLSRCTVDSISVRNCSAGVKLQQPSADVTIGQVIVDTCGEASALNSGMKIQGDATYPAGTDRPTRIRVGQVIATNQANIGLYMYHTLNCSVDSYVGYNNVLLHTANADVLMSGGIGDYVGTVTVRNSQGGGVRLSSNTAGAGPTGYRLPHIRVVDCGQNASNAIRSAVRVDAPSSGTIGELVAIDDQGSPTMSRGLDVIDTTSTGTVASFTATGYTDVAFASNSPGFGHPSNAVNQLVTGEEVLSRDLMTTGSLALTSGTLRLSYFTARKTESTTQVRVVSGSTAAGATPTLFRIGLYSIDSAGAGTLVASTVSDTALFAATATVYTKSWSTPYTKIAGQRYAIGVLVVTAAAVPTIAGISPTTTAEAGLPPRLTGALASQTDLPASFTNASLAASFSRLYAALA